LTAEGRRGTQTESVKERGLGVKGEG